MEVKLHFRTIIISYHSSPDVFYLTLLFLCYISLKISFQLHPDEDLEGLSKADLIAR